MVKLEQKYAIDHEKLARCISTLPQNYNFQMDKVVNTITQKRCRNIAIQFPDGLLRFAYVIIDTIKVMCDVDDVIILADVVYGACCIDDESAFALGCDFLLHFGHSCLFPMTSSKVKHVLYVFVDIYFDPTHAIKMIEKVADAESTAQTNLEIQKGPRLCRNISNFGENSPKHLVNESAATMSEISGDENPYKTNQANNPMQLAENEIMNYEKYHNFAIMGTVQFNSIVNHIARTLKIQHQQIKPLSKGEVLGCTAPKITNKNICIYIADGRFHLEAIMIQNPHMRYYKYDPFTKKMTKEYYDYNEMIALRRKAKNDFVTNCKTIGVIFGDLGRQGSAKILKNVVSLLEDVKKRYFILYYKEINDVMLKSIHFCDGFVQIGCPRLSIDWGHNFCKPLLNPYEFFNDLSEYTLDHYSKEKSEQWNHY